MSDEMITVPQNLLRDLHWMARRYMDHRQSYDEAKIYVLVDIGCMECGPMTANQKEQINESD